jgi:ADP-dependent phosphofructokinase/glucokinase
MDYHALYEEVLHQMESDAEKCRETGKRLVLGYTSDLDVVLKWDGDAFSRIIQALLTEEPRYAPGDTIASMGDFARIALHFLANGAGGEIDITEIKVCNELERRFETAYALGGTCAQSAAALGAVGFPVTAYITDRSEEVCARLNYTGMRLFANGRVAPVGESASDDAPVKHIILQYPKGWSVTWRGKTYTAPVSNRLILDYDTIHKILPIDPKFLACCEENAGDIYAYGISGFNGILDPAVMAERLSELTGHYRAFRAKNPEAILYLEGAYYLNPAVKDLAFETLARAIDILGMNEEELVEHAARFGLSTDVEDIDSILAALSLLLRQYPAKGIVMHTKDYSMYYGSDIPGIDFHKGLALGNLMSSTRARTGRYGTRSDCRVTIDCLTLSRTGLKMAEALCAADTRGHFAAIVPTRYMEHPLYTIGLGDTFTAGMLTAFIH